MHISKRGLDELIKPHEGYHTKQKDGSCKAYLCPAGVWTVGYGCTSGVTPNTQWTLEEAEAALMREMEEHEQNVDKLVKVPLNQGQFDALVSLCYNIGAGNLQKSTLLKHLNGGDYARAASHFSDFKYAKVQGATATRMKVAPGTSVVLPGLVERRANEAKFFLESEPTDPMPQKVEAPRAKLDVKAIVTKVAVPVSIGTATVNEVVKQGIPEVPAVAVKSVENISAWKGIGKSVLSIGGEIGGVLFLLKAVWPYILVASLAGAGLAYLKWRKSEQ